MILACAQTKPKRENIDENLIDHYRLIQMASDYGAELIVFPEMSISGYEREKAASLAFTPKDARIEPLISLAVEKKITIIAGAPIKVGTEMFIGEFILQPDGSVLIYTKQFLHPGEEEYYTSSFDFNPKINLANERISFSICADIDHPLHAENAKRADATLYISSLFFSPQGIPSAHKALSGYAKKHAMNVLMSNFSGETWGKPSGGRSAFWSNNGHLVVSMNDCDSGLIIVEKKKDQWSGQVIID